MFDEILEDSKKYGIIQTVTASVSLIASTTIIWIIFRSRTRLSTTFHRLLFGLCIADIISSFAQSLSTSMVPNEINYYIWNARGNVHSCDAQGFLIVLGDAWLYNCSLCFYYLSVVKYNKTDEYIRTKLEPLFHGLPIAAACIAAITGLATQSFNSTLVNCFPATYSPPHCTGYEDGDIPEGFNIPCGRGSDVNYGFLIFLVLKTVVIEPSVIIVTMTMMYLEVRKIEKKLQKYGVGALRANLQSRLDEAEPDFRSSVFSRLSRSSVFSKLRKSRESHQSISLRSNNSSRQSRTVLHRAISYAIANVATFIFPAIVLIRHIAGVDPGIYVWEKLALFLFPMQGFFNFLVFIYPGVAGQRASDKDISWCKAFTNALTSRGSDGKKKAKGRRCSLPKLNGDGKKSSLKQKRVSVEEEKSEIVMKTPLHRSGSLGKYAVNHVVNIDERDNHQSPNENELALIHSKGQEGNVDEEEKCEVDVEAPPNRSLSL
jgi:hypothetical protein